MAQFLTLSRAARLVGVSRSALQSKIRSNDLTTFEGMIKVTELLRAYPETKLEDTEVLDRVEQLKTDAAHKTPEEPALPSPKVLATRLTAMSQELSQAKSALAGYEALVETLLDKLSEAERVDDAHLRSTFQALGDWLVKEAEVRSIVSPQQAKLLAKDTFLRILAAQVEVIPSGHEFFVEGRDSILDAALRAGLNLNYGCSSGNCGACKARLVSGKVWKIREHDYVISEVEKNMGYMLMCANTAVTDLVLEAAEAGSVEDIPVQEINAKVKKLERLTDEVFALHVQTPRTRNLRFLAGQSAKLSLNDGVSARYPIASCPCDGRNLVFYIRQVPGDPFAEAIFRASGTQRSIRIIGPEGDFVLHEDQPNPVLFIAYGDGFAPIKSLIEHAISIELVESYHLYWIAPTQEDYYLNNLCRSWADALDNFRYTPLTATLQSSSLGQALRHVVEESPDLSRVHIYIAGPEPFVEVARAMLLQHRLPESQLHS